MRIILTSSEVKDVLNKHFGGTENHYELQLPEGSFALERRVGKERLSRMMKMPDGKTTTVTGIFEGMSVTVSVFEPEV